MLMVIMPVGKNHRVAESQRGKATPLCPALHTLSKDEDESELLQRGRINQRLMSGLNALEDEFWRACPLKNFDLISCLQCFETFGWAAGRASGP